MLRNLKNTNKNKGQNKLLKKKSKRVKKNLFKKSIKRKKKKKFLKVGGAIETNIILASNVYEQFKDFIHNNSRDYLIANNPKYLIKKNPELTAIRAVPENTSSNTAASEDVSKPPPLFRRSSFKGTSPNLLSCNGQNNDNCISCPGWKLQLRFEGAELKQQNLINKGAYGTVLKYSGTDKLGKEINLAVKFFSDPEDFNTERRLSQIIFDKLESTDKLDESNEKLDKFGVIPSYYSDECQILTMHFKDGDLTGLNLKDESNPTKIKIFTDVITFLIELAKQDLFYTDLKLENVLYQTTEDNPDSNYKIYLADIGGIIIGNPEDHPDIKFQMAPFTLPYKEYNIFTITRKEDISNLHFIYSFFQQVLSFLIYLFDILPRENLELYWTSFFNMSNGNILNPKIDADIQAHIAALSGKIKENSLFKEIIDESVFDKYFFTENFFTEEELNTSMTHEPSLSSYEITRNLIVKKLTEIKDSIFK